MSRITAIYSRPVYGFSGIWLYDTQVEVEADCEQLGDDVVVIWTDETREELVEKNFDADELEGAIESVEAAFWESEREEARLANVRQRAGATEAA